MSWGGKLTSFRTGRLFQTFCKEPVFVGFLMLCAESFFTWKILAGKAVHPFHSRDLPVRIGPPDLGRLPLLGRRFGRGLLLAGCFVRGRLLGRRVALPAGVRSVRHAGSELDSQSFVVKKIQIQIYSKLNKFQINNKRMPHLKKKCKNLRGGVVGLSSCMNLSRSSRRGKDATEKTTRVSQSLQGAEVWLLVLGWTEFHGQRRVNAGLTTCLILVHKMINRLAINLGRILFTKNRRPDLGTIHIWVAWVLMDTIIIPNHDPLVSRNAVPVAQPPPPPH